MWILEQIDLGLATISANSQHALFFPMNFLFFNFLAMMEKGYPLSFEGVHGTVFGQLIGINARFKQIVSF